MRTYTFQYFKGKSAPYNTIQAQDDEEAYEKIRVFLKQEGCNLFPGSIVRQTERVSIPDPPWLTQAERERDASILHYRV